MSSLDRFRAVILDDEGLQQELRQIADRPAFVTRIVALAHERGLELEPHDVEAALDATAKAWMLSWMQR